MGIEACWSVRRWWPLRVAGIQGEHFDVFSFSFLFYFDLEPAFFSYYCAFFIFCVFLVFSSSCFVQNNIPRYATVGGWGEGASWERRREYLLVSSAVLYLFSEHPMAVVGIFARNKRFSFVLLNK
jgi:hypothetical protein